MSRGAAGDLQEVEDREKAEQPPCCPAQRTSPSDAEFDAGQTLPGGRDTGGPAAPRLWIRSRLYGTLYGTCSPYRSLPRLKETSSQCSSTR